MPGPRAGPPGTGPEEDARARLLRLAAGGGVRAPEPAQAGAGGPSGRDGRASPEGVDGPGRVGDPWPPTSFVAPGLPVWTPVAGGPGRWVPDAPEVGRPRGEETLARDDPRPPRTAAHAGDSLRARAMAAAVAGYTAAHGHPLEHPAHDEPGGPAVRRWAVRPATVAVAVVVLALLVAAVSVIALRPPPSTVVGAPGAGSGAGGDGSPDPSGGGSAGAPDAEPDATGGAPPGGDASVPVHVPGAVAGTAGGTDVVVVHVVGQVAEPGVKTLPLGARVADALDAAGGALATADLAALNLARELTDGEQVLVPQPGEVVAATPGTSGGDGGVPALVDLNAADLAALDALPGIGPVLAERILAWREEHGRFTTVEELAEVPGIGPTLLGDLRDLVRV